MAYPIEEPAIRKYENQFFTYVTVSCYGEKLELIRDWAEGQIGYAVPDLLGWSVDGNYLYFYDSIIPDGCQPPGGFQRNLRQVELESGKIRHIPIDWTGGIALSPGTTKVVYYDREKLEVGIYDLVNGEEQRIPFEVPEHVEYWYAGQFTWSPDGQSALFHIQYGDPCFPTGGSIRRIDPQRNAVSILLEKFDQTLWIFEWTEPDWALIAIGTEPWRLDPFSGALESP